MNLSATVFFLAACGVAIYLWTHREPLPSTAAEKVFRSMMSGELPDQDVIDCPKSPLVDCSEASIRRLFAGYLAPRLRGYTVLSSKCYDFESGYGDVGFELQKSGRTRHVQLGAVLTPKGPRISLAAIIDTFWQLEAGYEGQTTKAGMFRRKSEASRLFRNELSEFGIYGMLQPHGKVLPWGEWDRLVAVWEPKLVDEELRLAQGALKVSGVI
jgi:hypothetical protein